MASIRKASGIAAGVVTLAIVGLSLSAENPSQAAEDFDRVQIATLLDKMEGTSPLALERMRPIGIAKHVVPDASVDVMRVQLDETYTIDGVGTDTVHLTGWIAVRHSSPRAAVAGQPISWNNSVVDTEFVGLDLVGHSDVFGAVRVNLDKDRPAVGQVGRIEIPELAKESLTTANRKGDAPAAAAPAEQPAAANTPESAQAPIESDGGIDINIELAACRAPVAVAVAMPDLGLEMKTKTHATWYSLVDTIPPVGQTASVTVDPIRLISAGREVGTLTSGIVKFREVVERVSLTPAASQDVQIAKNTP